MRQVCRNYDIDGIELDYFRSWVLFGTDPIGLEQTEFLNDMMREMRKMTEEEGLRRGRPILIAARFINDPNYALRFGYDVKTWLQEDLIDILMPLHISGHLGPLKSFIELAHHYDVPAYPCLRRVSREDVGAHGTTWEVCRGEAMSRFVEGADGITTFNRFDPTHQRWRELGDPKVLRDLDKTYTCPHDLPVTVTDRRSDPLRLLVGDDVRSTPPADKRRVLKLRVHVAGLTAEHGFQVELNGRTLEPAKISPALGDSPRRFGLRARPNRQTSKWARIW